MLSVKRYLNKHNFFLAVWNFEDCTNCCDAVYNNNVFCLSVEKINISIDYY